MLAAMNHILILLTSEEGTPKLNAKNTIQGDFHKTLICSKSKEGTAESSGATRFTNTSVDVQ